NLYEEEPDQPSTWIDLNEADQSPQREEKTEMPSPEEITKLEEEKKGLEEKLATEKARADKAEEAKGTAETKLSERDNADQSLKIKDMVKPLRDGGIAPVVADQLEHFAEKLDSTEVVKFGEKEHSAYDEFTEILNSLIKRNDDGSLVVSLGEEAPGTKGERSEAGGTEEQKTEAIVKYQEAHEGCDLKTATIEAAKANPTLFGN
ncbi:MAG: hypothetical protein V3T30_01400, partial [Thermodesulfobacteriota bacterium]